MRAPGFLAVLLVAACHGEPDFDERYDRASQEIRAKADAIDADLERRAKADGAAHPGDTPAAGPDRTGQSK